MHVPLNIMLLERENNKANEAKCKQLVNLVTGHEEFLMLAL
jgi:hypothetical protein